MKYLCICILLKTSDTFKFVELILISPVSTLLITMFWGGHETLLEAGVGIYDVGELPIQQGVKSLSSVFVDPDPLNTVG